MKETDAQINPESLHLIGPRQLEMPGAAVSMIVDGPLRQCTRGDARVLLFVTVLALIAKSGQSASILAWLSGPLSFKAPTVPFLLKVLVAYFLAVFVVHSASDFLIWWPSWLEFKKTMNNRSALLFAFAGFRFALEFCVPVVLAVFAF